MAQSSFWDEIRKIPPVTRFLCGSTLAVSLPVMLQVLPATTVIFVKELVTQRFEVWRLFSSFFLGSSGINFIFDFAMLYRNSNSIETENYLGRSADYAWQLLLAAAGILALNIPLRSYIHTRPLLLCLTYLSSSLAPPSAQTSFFGLLTLPVKYLPYVLVGLDLIMGGPQFAAQSISGCVVGHAWWYLVWREARRGPGGWEKAPGWLVNLVGNGLEGAGGSASGGVGGSGVHVIPPRREREQTTGGHRWGSGHRLGSD
ncbi:hypothetical protein JAAARDRAFT_126083 [Jaapia argillacea MUCL 33604]|uniref:Derlin n=1 Tax=Jaapia argillacea MUCL 33604 TaxID=933084 RepID=A0A067PZE2_9AGAM|nr:hypothetical protein JAAARDRAFT_126083 [Jaapia argillacea MUCL 33604]